ncbi:MAG: ATP-dependent helicase, partial [Opitutaceae bacterium]|nr:ATP-dependent helicase [Opitutaceae bacterium]
MDFLTDDEPVFIRPRSGAVASGIDFKKALNEEQFAVVTADADAPPPLLVLAGAGSGKTRTLTYRVAYLLSRGVRPGEILLLTFTNKAAREMLHRVNELTGEEPGRFWGGTFHSIGCRALRMFGDAIGVPKNFTVLDADDAEGVLKRAVEGCDKLFFKDKRHPKPGPLHGILSLARNTRLPLDEVVERFFPQHREIAGKLAEFDREYGRRRREQNVLDFDDLLELWLRLVREAPDVGDYFRRRFRHILVDEYQDTNALQSQLIDEIGTHQRIMVVGDDAQCIYSWRGADFENIMSFPKRHPGTRIHRIETNYRSTPQILALANGVLGAQPRGRHFDKELKAAREGAQKPFLVGTFDGTEQARFVAARAAALHEEEGLAWSDIAVLYRAHYQSLDVQLELSRAGIPYQITSGVRFFERQHVRDVVATLRFISNTGDEAAWLRIAMLLPGVGEKGAEKTYRAAREHADLLRVNMVDALVSDDVKSKVPKDAKAEWEGFCASLREVGAAMGRASPAEAVRLAIEGWYGDYMKGQYADYIERLEELKALAGFAARFTDIREMLAQIVLLSGETGERQVDAPPDA